MSARIRAVEYYTVTVNDPPEVAYRLLSQVAASGVNLLAFNAIPVGLHSTQLVLFPTDAGMLASIAEQQRLDLSGPERALLIQGDDELGAIARVHEQLAAAGVHPYASAGVTDGGGDFGYVVYLRKEEYAAAARALAL